MTKGERFDKFVSGLKFEVRLEVMKSTVSSFEEATKIALRVDSALWSAQSVSSVNNEVAADAAGPTAMEIGNVEGRRFQRRRGNNQQRVKDMRNNACFTCHKPGCRPWKHENDGINNAELGKAHCDDRGDGGALEDYKVQEN